MIKAVIFDMDGVIAETELAHIKAEKEVMLRYGVKVTSAELRAYTGTTPKCMFDDLIRKYHLRVSFEKIFAQKDAIMFKLLKREIKPVKGAINFIKKLKKNGMKLAVASSSHRKLITFILKKFKILKMFRAVIAGEDVLESKPDPAIFLKAAAKIRVAPEDCLVIEDSHLGVLAAKAAGMKCVGYRNLRSGKQDLRKADKVVRNFERI